MNRLHGKGQGLDAVFAAGAVANLPVRLADRPAALEFSAARPGGCQEADNEVATIEIERAFDKSGFGHRVPQGLEDLPERIGREARGSCAEI